MSVYLGFTLHSSLEHTGTGQRFDLLLEFGDAVGEGGERLHDLTFVFCLHGFVLFQFGYQQLQKINTWKHVSVQL